MGDQLLNRSTPIAETALRALHPRSIVSAAQILQVLERGRENGCVSFRGINTQVDLDAAPLWTDTLEQQRFALGLGTGWEQVYGEQGVFVFQFTGETL